MILCKDCDWWSKDVESNGIQRPCNNPKVGPDGNGEDEAADSEAFGGIYTGKNFGCIHGRIKEMLKNREEEIFQDTKRFLEQYKIIEFRGM